jgi:hypothetical protein
MKRVFLLLLFIGISSTMINAENNNSIKMDNNNSKKIATQQNKSKKTDITKKHVQEQIEREKKYAKEQIFYQGSDYDLSHARVNEKSLSSIPVIEPDYDFNMDDAYSDQQ